MVCDGPFFGLFAYRLALLLRVVDARKRRVEAVCRAHHGEVEAEVAPEHLLHLLGLAPAQQAVVHEDAVQAPADRAVEENGHHGRIDAAGEA